MAMAIPMVGQRGANICTHQGRRTISPVALAAMEMLCWRARLEVVEAQQPGCCHPGWLWARRTQPRRDALESGKTVKRWAQSQGEEG
jgi:hypothetical protein